MLITNEGGDALGLEMMGDEFPRPLVDCLVPGPNCEGQRLHAFHIGSPVHFGAQHVGRRSHAHCLCMLGPNAVAELIVQVVPLVNMLVQVLDLSSLLEVL